MFYEERVIDGILHSRTSPDRGFEPVSQRQLTAMLLREREDHKRTKLIAREIAYGA